MPDKHVGSRAPPPPTLALTGVESKDGAAPVAACSAVFARLYCLADSVLEGRVLLE